MSIAEPVQGLVGLARRANLLAIGFAACAEAVNKNKAAAILLAEDLSAASATRFRKRLGAFSGPIEIHGKKSEWGRLLGREQAGILAILDRGLAAAISEKLRAPGSPDEQQ